MRVGPYLYEVCREPAKRLKGSNADCDRNYLVMGVDPTLPASKQVVELVHEVVHAVADLVSGPDYDASDKDVEPPRWDEEQVATLFAPLLVMVLRDNPDLVEAICGV